VVKDNQDWLNPRLNLTHLTFDALTCNAKKLFCRRIRLSCIFDRFGCIRANSESERDANADTDARFHGDADAHADDYSKRIGHSRRTFGSNNSADLPAFAVADRDGTRRGGSVEQFHVF
jgi:hypothetical protein